MNKKIIIRLYMFVAAVLFVSALVVFNYGNIPLGFGLFGLAACSFIAATVYSIED